MPIFRQNWHYYCLKALQWALLKLLKGFNIQKWFCKYETFCMFANSNKIFVFRPKGLKNSQYCKFKFGVQGFHNFSAIRKHVNKSKNWPSSQIKSRLHCIEIFDDDCNFSVLCFSDIDIYV